MDRWAAGHRQDDRGEHPRAASRLRLYSADTANLGSSRSRIAAGSEAARRWEALTPDERRVQPTQTSLPQSLYARSGARWSSTTSHGSRGGR